jgi:hypothetical protein
VEARSLLPPRAPEGPALPQADGRRIARLERTVRELEAERDALRADLALARSWVRDLLGWIERNAEPRAAAAPDRPPTPVRRAATIAALALTPWLLIGGGIAAGLALS